ncbi:MAG TPA: serine hydrolase domain-containing protein [Xanthomonadaceae bacterium]|jgi:CubicO group peptidase (beta-lactamase class C family)
MRVQLLCLALVLWICSPTAAADPTSAAAPSPAKGAQHREAGTPASTPAGTTFTIPDGWTMTMKGRVVVLSPAEPDLEYALIDVEAKDAAAAVAAGWADFAPGFKRPLRVSEPNPPLFGWEERVFFDYEVSPNEKLVVHAYAWRAGKNWLVGMLQSSLATEEKRAGPFSLVHFSERPKGYRPEVFSGKPAHPIDAQMIAAMKQFVASGMQQLQVPGVGFSLIDKGKIVYEGGLGVRELGKPDPVDADTLFMAASNTKALSTLMLAELVDAKKLRWDEPVTEAYSSFKLGDAATTRQVLIKQLVCACTGMPRQDYDRKFANGQRDTPATAIERLGTMQPTSKFGEVYQYSNPLAAAAGFIGGAVAFPDMEMGKAYDQAMQQMVFDPLGMTHSTFDFAKAMQGDYARPHDVDLDGHLIVGQISPNYTIIPLRPSGGLWTSAHDLSQYVMMELAKGMLPNGQRLVSEKNLLQRRVPNVAAGENIDYGMGLEIETIAGVTVIHHGGSLEGYKSDMIWLPDYDVGAVILTNSDAGSTLDRAFLRKLMEVLFDGRPEAEGQVKAVAAMNAIERLQMRKELQVPADPVVAAKLAAQYDNEALGAITFTRDGKDVVLHDGYLQSTMASRRNEDGSISIVSIAPNMQGLFAFVIGERDHKRTLTLRDAQHEYVFVEQ